MQRIVQSSTVTAILNHDLTYRQIFMDGRTLEPNPHPTWMGYSVGRWDDDTLVVESNGYNDKTWLHRRGLPHTERLRMTERYHRSDFGHMLMEITFEDPGTFDCSCGWGYSFRTGDDGIATRVDEIHVSGAWTLRRVP